jgi:iron complex transport system substrate-binding protein
MPVPNDIARHPAPWLMLLALWLAGPPVQASGEIRVTDDAGRELVLPQPARRVVSLSPHLTEILFHVAAGDRLVGTVRFGDHPPEATRLPQVGSAGHLDLERIVSLQPDLVVAWQSGNPSRQVEQLERLGIPVYLNEPRRLEDLAGTLERLSLLTGTGEAGPARAQAFRERGRALAEQYAGLPPVRLFYQIWDSPLMTINDTHLIGELIALCGGVNVFGDLPALAPRVSREAVLAADPEVIVGGGPAEDDGVWLEEWRQWETLTAVGRDNLFFIPPSLIQRQTPRILEGAALLCEFLDEARDRRPEGRE